MAKTLQANQIADAIITAPGVRVVAVDASTSGSATVDSATFTDVDANLDASFLVPVAGKYRVTVSGHLYGTGYTSYIIGRFRLNFDDGELYQQYIGGSETPAEYGAWDFVSNDIGAWTSYDVSDEVTFDRAGVHTCKIQWARMATGGGGNLFTNNVVNWTVSLEAITGSGAGGVILSKTALSGNVAGLTGNDNILSELTHNNIVTADETLTLDVNCSIHITSASYIGAQTLKYRVDGGSWVILSYETPHATLTATNLNASDTIEVSAGSHTVEFAVDVSIQETLTVYGPATRSSLIRHRGGLVPWERDGVAVLDTPRAINIVGGVVDVADDGSGKLEVSLPTAVTAPGVIDSEAAYPTASVSLDTTDTYKQIYPGATARTFSPLSSGDHRVELDFCGLLSDDAAFENYRFKVEFDDGVNPAVVVGDDESWQYRKYVGFRNGYIPLHFVGVADLDTGQTYDVKVYGKRVGAASTIMGVQNSNQPVQVTIQAITGSGAGGEIVGYLEKEAGSDAITTAFPTWTEPTYSAATFWDLDFIAAHGEEVVIEFDGQGRATTGSRAAMVARLLLDGSQLGHFQIATSDDIGDYANWTITRKTGALTGGTHNVKLEMCQGSAGENNFELQGSTLTIRQMRGGLVPISKDGVLVQDKPRAINYGSAFNVTDNSGAVSVRASNLWRYLSAANLPTGAAAPEAVWRGDSLSDQTANGHDLTVTGGTALYTAAEGLTGWWSQNSFRLTADNPSGLVATGAFTAVFIASLDRNANSSAFLQVGANSEAEADNSTVYFYMSSHSLNAFWEYGAGANDSVTSVAYPPAGPLVHIAFTRASDGITHKFYVDGVLLDTQVGSNAPTGGTSGVALLLGNPATGNNFYGALFSALATKEEWSAAQVLESYQYCRRLD